VTIGRPITIDALDQRLMTFAAGWSAPGTAPDVVQRAVGVGLSANWIVVSDSPSVIDDEMCRTPSTPDTPSPMFWYLRFRSAGAAPNWRPRPRSRGCG